MTGWGRAFYGAAIGSILTLIAHPASRPLILGLWCQPAELVTKAKSSYALEGQPSLPRPQTLEQASLWVQSGADRIPLGVKPTPAEVSSLLRIVRAASDLEPENAFWRQMEVVYLRDQDNLPQARRVWLRSSTCLSWNDYQSNRLISLQQALQSNAHSKMSWQALLAFYQRSTGPAVEILSAARWLLSAARKDNRENLELRLATVRNATLMTDGSRSIQVGRVGSHIFDLACDVEPSQLMRVSDRYRARYALKERIRKVLGTAGADAMELLIRRDDGWGVLTSTDPANDNPSEVRDLSGLTGSLPGAFFGLGLVGLFLFGIGSLARFWPSKPPIRLAMLLFIAIGLGILAYAAVRLPLVGVLVALAVTFQAISPVEGDRRQLKRLGSLFELAVTVFAVALIAVLGMLFVGSIAPGASSLLLLGVPQEYLFGSTILLGIVIVIMCLMLVVPPAWAITHRVSTSQVIRLMFQRLGALLAAVCLTTAVLATPIMMLVDRGLSEKMDKLLANEPLYYVHP